MCKIRILMGNLTEVKVRGGFNSDRVSEDLSQARSPTDLRP